MELPDQIDLAGMTDDIISRNNSPGGPPVLYRYDGSITVPPCTEGAKFYVAVSRTGINTAQKITYEYAMQVSACLLEI